MGIEPTWDSLHCPTPDLKSGSPTSELGTSGHFITKMANRVEKLVTKIEKDDLVRAPLGELRAGKAVPTATPKTVAYSNILIYDLFSGKKIAVIQPIGGLLEGLESI